MILRTVVIGLGKQMTEDHLPAAMESDNFDVLAICDNDTEKVNKCSAEYKLEGFLDIDRMLKKIKCDVAIVAVPHNQYLPVITKLAEKEIHVIKEKPFSTCLDEAQKIHQLISGKNLFLGVILQRRFNPVFQAFHQLKKRIGKIYSIEGCYVMNISHLDEGWRSSKDLAGGGALIDMGYHFIDLLVWYMGLPTSITARLSRGNRIGQEYNVEDTVNLLFDYSISNYDEKVVGNFIISRVYPQKSEKLTVMGSKGIVAIERGKIRRLDACGKEIETLERKGGWPSAAIDQLDFFAEVIQSKNFAGVYDYREHFKHIAIIEAAYESDKNSTSCDPRDFLITE